MKTLLLSFLLLSGMTIASRAAADVELLQKGLYEEEVNRDLKAAIPAYRQVVDQFEIDRKIAATAMFRLAECYRRRGETNEALTWYRRIVRDFSDQNALVQQAQPRVLALDPSMPSVNEAATATWRGQKLEFLPATNEEAAELQKIKTMIRDSPDLIHANTTGRPLPLYEAACSGWLAVAELLIVSGANLNDRGPVLQPNALHGAAQQGHKRMVELLLAKGAEVNLPDSDGETALHKAARGGFRQVVEVLLKHGARVDAKAKTGVTALHWAVLGDQLPIVEMLLDAGAEINAKGRMGGILAVCRLNPSCRPDTTPVPSTALHAALWRNYDPILRLLLARGADVNATNDLGVTPLHLLAFSNRVDLAEDFLKRGADPNVLDADGVSPLMVALNAERTMEQRLAMTRLLLAQRADPNARSRSGVTAIWTAIAHGMTDCAEALLAGGATPNVPGPPTWRPPLHKAIEDGRRDLVEMLLKHGADVNYCDASEKSSRDTPLHVAAWRRNKDLVELLLAHKADPNLTNYAGDTPLRMLERAIRGPSVPLPSNIPGTVRPVETTSPTSLIEILKQATQKQ